MDNKQQTTGQAVKKVGRPRANIDRHQFESLCGLQCTQEEICNFFGITDKTLTRWCRETYGKRFSEVFREKRELGRVSLRRNQWKLAEKNATMAIFLGKNYLGQKDVQDINQEFTLLDKEASKLDELLAQRKERRHESK